MHLGGLEALALPIGSLKLYLSMTTKIHTLTSGWTKSSFDFQKKEVQAFYAYIYVQNP